MSKWSKAIWRGLVVIPAVIGMLAITQAEAEIVTLCRSSTGHAFYFAGPLVGVENAGWQTDSISSGQILLIYNGDEPDIVHTSATGSTKSARGEGGAVFEVAGADAGVRLILVVYPTTGTIENYLFVLDADGVGTVAWGLARAAIMLKSSLMTATCQSP